MSRPLVRSSKYSILETTEFISVQFILGRSTLKNMCRITLLLIQHNWNCQGIHKTSLAEFGKWLQIHVLLRFATLFGTFLGGMNI
jgi:hypothetical protein